MFHYLNNLTKLQMSDITCHLCIWALAIMFAWVRFQDDHNYVAGCYATNNKLTIYIHGLRCLHGAQCRQYLNMTITIYWDVEQHYHTNIFIY